MNRRGFLELITLGTIGTAICNKLEANEKKKLQEAFKKIEEYDIEPKVVFCNGQKYSKNGPYDTFVFTGSEEEYNKYLRPNACKKIGKTWYDSYINKPPVVSHKDVYLKTFYRFNYHWSWLISVPCTSIEELNEMNIKEEVIIMTYGDMNYLPSSVFTRKEVFEKEVEDLQKQLSKTYLDPNMEIIWDKEFIRWDQIPLDK